MSYTPTVWETGDVVTAEKLNKLELGVQEANQSDGGSGIMFFDITREGTFPNTYLVSSKTFTELVSAISSGFLPVARYEYFEDLITLLSLFNYSDTVLMFSAISVEKDPDDNYAVSACGLTIASTNEVIFDIVDISPTN